MPTADDKIFYPQHCLQCLWQNPRAALHIPCPRCGSHKVINCNGQIYEDVLRSNKPLSRDQESARQLHD